MVAEYLLLNMFNFNIFTDIIAVCIDSRWGGGGGRMGLTRERERAIEK